VDRSEIAAVGDWWNDVGMFRTAGRSFVMAGAPPEVIAAATDRLTSVCGEGGGVAEALALLAP
jgi:hydroxymethylpyrimidine pyrophosphatase-like HAD family hydrolase